MIKRYKTIELPSDLKTQIDGIIDGEFGHIPIVKETEWARPDWTFIYFIDNKIASFYHIVEREITIDSVDFAAAGVNNVITVPEYRGQGLSSKLLRDTNDFIFKDLKKNIGILLCADDLLPFYERLGWYRIDCPVYFRQKKAEKLWTANTMLLNHNGTLLSPEEVNLNGLPW